MRTQHGFTLIELMITVAIIAILSMIGYPSYRDYVVRGNIPDATSKLATKQVQMEQFFQDNRTYVGSTGAGLPCATDTTAKFFDFGCSGVTATGFTLSATGKSSMAGFGYSVDQSGGKTTSAVPSASGWSRPSPNNCWATNKGGAC